MPILASMGWISSATRVPAPAEPVEPAVVMYSTSISPWTFDLARSALAFSRSKTCPFLLAQRVEL